MGLAHTAYPLHGVQFHPESVLSEHGARMVANFIALAAAWNAGRRERAAGDKAGAGVH